MNSKDMVIFTIGIIAWVEAWGNTNGGAKPLDTSEGTYASNSATLSQQFSIWRQGIMVEVEATDKTWRQRGG